MLAKVSVEAAVYAIDKPYTYLLPADLTVLPGMRVVVPFGRGNRRSEGIVLSVEEGEDPSLKFIESVLDHEPLLDAEMLRLAAFLRERFFCTFYDAVKAILPAGVFVRAETVYVRTERPVDVADEDEKALLAFVEELGGSASEAVLKKNFPEEILQKLVKRGFLHTERELSGKTADKAETVLELAVDPEEAAAYASAHRRKAPMQAAVLELLAVTGAVSQKELCYFTGASRETVKRLRDLGFLTEGEQEVLRSSVQIPAVLREVPALNTEQRYVFDGLRKQAVSDVPGAALLYGVTGSGKTAVYLSLIRDCLQRGKSAMLLVPEIALTPQLVNTLTGHFGEKVAVLHSRLRIGERYDEWKRIRRGEASVVVGTRSAVFAPLKDPGIFILDEEHEHSYKSEQSPRYHARDVAAFRAIRSGALLLLGSATPSVESMYRARSGQYTLYTLKNRYNGKPLPMAELVDMKQELREGNGSCLSRRLQNALRDNEGKQAILFLNRRGSSRMLICVDCGHVPQCPNCSVNLTYHRANSRLMCHYCGYSQTVFETCPACGGHLKMVGFGTQRVQTELEDVLPGKQVLRMDADTVSATNTHEMILRRFEEEEIPVLVGTQMVTKGLNFPKVTLVGVLDADSALYVENYRASETAFSMITQVAGRSGRGEEEGLALIQTMTPENAVISMAARQDYDGFYALELPLRQLRGCPPFADLIMITFSGLQEQNVLDGAVYFREMLTAALPQTQLSVRVMGPAPAPIAKVSNRYRFRLTLSLQNCKEARRLIAWALKTYLKDNRFRDVSAFADVNPYE
ncbi:MAG: primosomal protein N' [Oscillospiraceae bacterium]|nr:primosomal protein N' [Oscillospiraceae bacterium]